MTEVASRYKHFPAHFTRLHAIAPRWLGPPRENEVGALCYPRGMRDAPVADALTRALAGRADVEVALLFGSRARGEHRPASDVDVAVLGPADRLALAADLTRATGREVEVVDLAAAGYPLLSAIVVDGLLVHEGVPGAYARWRSHALSELDLDRAWYARMRDGYLAKLAEGAGRR